MISQRATVSETLTSPKAYDGIAAPPTAEFVKALQASSGIDSEAFRAFGPR